MPSTSMGAKQFMAEQTKSVVAGGVANNGEHSPSCDSKYLHEVDKIDKAANYKVDPALGACRGSLLVASGRPNLDIEKHEHHSSKKHTKSDIASSAPTGISSGEHKNNDLHVSDFGGEDVQSVIASSSDVVGNWYASEISLERVTCRSYLESSTQDDGGTFNDNVFVLSCACKVCNCLESRLKMLICDRCEEPYHLSCCVPTVKNINFDEWYCENCKKKKRKLLFGLTKKGKRPKILLGSSGYKKKLWKGSSIIYSMLDATEHYDSGVRLGAAFQAEVPEWSGPAISDADNYYDEPEKLDVTASLRLDVKKPHVDSKPRLMKNWLQCREVLTTDEDGKEVICGKWRRSPILEVQTNEWSCYDSVAWDRSRSDCTVPQEISTIDVMSHLKYVKLLKEQLENKKPKNMK